MAGPESGPGWHDLPLDVWPAWRAIFDRSKEGIDLAAPCPVCSVADLHRWFHLNRAQPTEAFGQSWAGRGSGWEWCSKCMSYVHFSGLVPTWWADNLAGVDSGQLRHDPGPIEQVRRQHVR